MIKRIVDKGLVRVNGRYYQQMPPLESGDGQILKFTQTCDSTLIHQLDKTGLKTVGFWQIVNSPTTAAKRLV